MKTYEKIDKYLKEGFNAKGLKDQLEMFYNNWGGAILEMSTDSNNLSKVQGKLKQADKAYNTFIKSMEDAEKLARKG